MCHRFGWKWLCSLHLNQKNTRPVEKRTTNEGLFYDLFYFQLKNWYWNIFEIGFELFLISKINIVWFFFAEFLFLFSSNNRVLGILFMWSKSMIKKAKRRTRSHQPSFCRSKLKYFEFILYFFFFKSFLIDCFCFCSFFNRLIQQAKFIWLVLSLVVYVLFCYNILLF